VHQKLAAWLTERVHDMLPDKGAQRLLRVLFHAQVLFVFARCSSSQPATVLVQQGNSSDRRLVNLLSHEAKAAGLVA
jgi:hypothetical protein